MQFANVMFTFIDGKQTMFIIITVVTEYHLY